MKLSSSPFLVIGTLLMFIALITSNGSNTIMTNTDIKVLSTIITSCFGLTLFAIGLSITDSKD